MDISPRNKIRFAAIAVAALVIGLGYWLTHRNGGTSSNPLASLLGGNSTAPGSNLAAPIDPLTPPIDPNTGVPTGSTTTASSNSGSPVVSAPGNPGSSPIVGAPSSFDPGSLVPGSPIWQPFTPPSTPGGYGAATQATVKSATYTPSALLAHPNAPAGHTQANAVAQLGSSLNTANQIPIFGPILEVGAIGGAASHIYAQGVATNNPVTSALNWIAGIGSTLAGAPGAATTLQKTPAKAGPPAGTTAYLGGHPNSATAASQLAHRGGTRTPPPPPQRTTAQVLRTRARAALN